jgi:phosphopantetheinyl transferase
VTETDELVDRVLGRWGAGAARDREGRPIPRGRDDLSVSASHTEGMLLVGVGERCRVGVDVETLADRGIARLPEHALTAAERSELDRAPREDTLRAFLSYWTRKEAILKAAGVGLATEPSLIELPPSGEGTHVLAVPAALGPAGRWSVNELRIDGYVAAVAADVPAPEVSYAIFSSGAYSSTNRRSEPSSNRTVTTPSGSMRVTIPAPSDPCLTLSPVESAGTSMRGAASRRATGTP